jgi:hypothetical protein
MVLKDIEIKGNEGIDPGQDYYPFFVLIGQTGEDSGRTKN